MNNPAYQAYSIRQLSPFQGLVQVVRADYARAISVDGHNWQIHVSCEVHQQQWGIMNAPDIQRRYVLYGMWNAATGLSSLPLDPTLDVPAAEDIETGLLGVLRQNIQLPLPQRDHYELWSLDADTRPIALLASSTDEHNLVNIEARRWRAIADRSRNFQPPHYQGGGDALLALERLISNAGISPLSTQWFLRDADGSGQGLDGMHSARPLEAEQFPPLLIREDWPQQQNRLLCMDYHDWHAPRLLMLQTLPDDLRDRLERAAQQQALEASRFHHLYPKVINNDIINHIRVEARLRKSGHSTG